MNNNRNASFRPGTKEVDEITKRARKGGRDGAIVGGTAGYVGGAFAPRGLRKARVVGAAVGAIGGHIIGKTIARKNAARDDVASRRALREMNARLDRLVQLADARDNSGDDWYQDRVAQARLEVRKKYGPAMERAMSNEQCLAAVERRGDDNDASYMPGVFHRADDVTDFDAPGRRDSLGNYNEINHDGQHPVRVYPKVRKPYSVDGIDYQGEYELSPSRLALIEKYGIGIVTAIPEDQLTEEACKRLADAFLATMRRADSPGGGVAHGEDFERKYFSAKLGADVVSRMGKAEIHAHFVAAQRNGLVELTDDQDATNFIDTRLRSQSGTFLPGDAIAPGSVERAYSPGKDRKTGRNIAAASAGTAGLVGAALLATRKLKRAKVPRLGNGGAPALAAFAARNDDNSHTARNAAIAGGLTIAGLLAARKLRRGRIPRLGTSGKVVDVDASPLALSRRTMPTSPFPGNPVRLVKRPKRGVKSGQTFRSPQPQLPVSNFGNLAGSLAEGLIDAAGLGSATSPKKKKKLLVNSDGIFVDDNGVPLDPQPTSFSVAGRLGSAAAKYGPEGLVIGSADLVAERANAAIEARKKRQKKLLRQGGIQAVSPAGPTTMAAINSTLIEFDSDGARERAKRHAATLGATVAGGAVGSYAGLRHEPGHVAQPGEIQPGSTVYRRREGFIPTRHYGVVDEGGNVAHRTAGRDTIRNVKIDTFRKLGKGRTYVEPPRRSDRTPSQTAAAASAAKGTNSGRYSTVGNNCEHATSRMSGGKAVSRQVRRAVGGAAIGAAGAGSLAEILKHRRQQSQK